jgi:hypothetical protein
MNIKKITQEEQKKLDLLSNYYSVKPDDMIVTKNYAYVPESNLKLCGVYEGTLQSLENNKATFTNGKCIDVDSNTNLLKKKTAPPIVSFNKTQFYFKSLLPRLPLPPLPPSDTGGRKRRKKTRRKSKKNSKRKRNTRKHRRRF